MNVARKLQIRPAMTVVVLGRPSGVDLEIPSECLVVSDPADAATADAVVAFVVRAEDLDTIAAPALEAARDDRLAWILYPKNRQLGTDVNRDILAALAAERGAHPVRQIAIDAVWSALRFRPA
ncbi:hypothetical protein GCM10009798_35420 [Nocardioides panacihumi]|uniref:DUF3052 domain-containing protein n=1 Tax=Nocardioides panacihumi TaxID=400774 RepID=A0ABN2RLY9_9ACTN